MSGTEDRLSRARQAVLHNASYHFVTEKQKEDRAARELYLRKCQRERKKQGGPPADGRRTPVHRSKGKSTVTLAPVPWKK